MSGEYPPQQGGVADYTRLVARGLVARGDRVHVWAPAVTAPELAETGVEVHRLPAGFGPRTLAALGRGLDAAGPGQILVQYVPQGFGMKGMNLPLCLWLFARRRAGITIMFHEVALALGWQQSVRHNVLGAVHFAMALVLMRAARRCFVGAAAWEKRLRPLAPAGAAISWLPVPSNVPVVDDPAGVRAVRKTLMVEGGLILGHFGTARESWIAERLAAVVPPLLHERADAAFLLVGRDSPGFRSRLLAAAPELRARVRATGPLAPADASRHLGACDLMLQPYDDGVSTRRTSLMAALAHRRPVVTTAGRFTEPLWRESGAVALVDVGDIVAMRAALTHLMDDAGERARLGAAAGALYAQRFDITHTIAALREGC
ncbi:MAG TPA: glycosyltransferase [Candidatus Binataceae bacterium]|nr:glycosyltransferase [Candidatus Binataceae bacterium]